MNTDALTDFLKAMLAADVAIASMSDADQLAPVAAALRDLLHQTAEAGRVVLSGKRLAPTWVHTAQGAVVGLMRAEQFSPEPVTAKPVADAQL